MNEATSREHKAEEDSTELVSHYRPLGLKAVLAACAVKPQAKPTSHREPSEMFGNLPEGFHMPQALDD